MSDNIRTQALKWFVETGYVDGGGVGYWVDTEESVEVASEAAARALRDQWLEQGKLVCNDLGVLHPNVDYGSFRIRSVWVDVPNPLADRIEALEDALAWCSGSADFNEGGIAREGWLKLCAPLLKGGKDE